MIILDDITRSLQIKLSAAPVTELKVTASYVDFINPKEVVNPLTQITTTTNTTALDFVSPPDNDGTERQLKAVYIPNENAASVTVIIIFNDNTVLNDIIKITLSSGDCLQYIDTRGFYVIDANGREKTTGNKTSTRKVVDGTLTNATADLFTATAETEINSIVFVDIDATDRTFDAYIKTVASGADIEFTQVLNPIAASDAVYVTIPLNLASGDILRGKASANSAVTWLMSYTEYA